MGSSTIVLVQMSMRKNGDLVNSECMSVLPSFPRRFELNGAWINAMSSGSDFELRNVLCASFAMCWDANPTDDDWKTFRECGHDPVAFGEQAQDYAWRHSWDVNQMYKEGRRVLDLMVEEVRAVLNDGVAEEESFSADQEGAITT